MEPNKGVQQIMVFVGSMLKLQEEIQCFGTQSHMNVDRSLN